MLGVDSDSKPRLKQLIESKLINWECLWDKGIPLGPLATAWQVDRWPTTFLIDKKGMIRQVGHSSDLEESIEKLLDEKS
jgi:peroxiredoxin